MHTLDIKYTVGKLVEHVNTTQGTELHAVYCSITLSSGSFQTLELYNGAPSEHALSKILSLFRLHFF